MDAVLFSVLSIVLLVVFIQDYKYRAIHVSLPILIFVISIILWVVHQNLYVGILYNSAFLMINFLSLKLYTVITNKQTEEGLYFGGLGLGDVLFFVAIIPLFNLVNFMFFFVTGIVFSMVMHLGNRLVSKNKYVPLAGYLSVYLILILGYSFFNDYSLYLNLI